MNRFNGSYKQNTLITILWWTFWLFAQTMVFHRIGLSWQKSFTESLITTFVLAMIGIVISNTYRYYRPMSKNYYLLAGYIIILTVLTGRVLYWTFAKLEAGNPFYLEDVMKYMPLRGMFYFLMIAFMTAFYWFRNNSLEQVSMKKREEEAELLLRDAELAKLRQQLQPHFLFNSLNSISALAGSKPDEARKMIQQLSDFLRGTLRKDEQQMVPLEEELAHLTLYLDIEKVRFGHRLATEINVPTDCRLLKLPSLLLQPIVENAVKFGLYDTTDAIVIRIHASIDNGDLLVSVLNPFDPRTARPSSGTGFGLSSVQRRLYLLFARNDLLMTSNAFNIFTTTVRIPQSK